MPAIDPDEIDPPDQWPLPDQRRHPDPWEHSGIRTASYIACVILGASFFAGLATCVGNVVTLLDVMGHPRQHIDGAIWIPIHGLAWSLSGTGGTLLAWIGACFLVRYETERLAELAHKAKQQAAQ